MNRWLLISLAVAVVLVLAGGGLVARVLRPGAGQPGDDRIDTRRRG